MYNVNSVLENFMCIHVVCLDLRCKPDILLYWFYNFMHAVAVYIVEGLDSVVTFLSGFTYS